MPRPYSIDLRKRVVSADGSEDEIADTFDIGVSTLRRWRARKRETGSVAPAPHRGGHPPGVPIERRNELAAIVAEKPDRTLEELVELLKTRLGLTISVSGMSRTLIQMGLSRKKNRSRRSSS